MMRVTQTENDAIRISLFCVKSTQKRQGVFATSARRSL